MPKQGTTDTSTPDTSTPDRIGTYIREVVEDLFTGDSIREDLRLKCRYHYIHAVIKSRQRQGKEVTSDMRRIHDEYEQELRQRGHTPSKVRRIHP
jgi:hypothetical protein